MSNELNIGGNSYGPNAVGRGARARQENVVIGKSDDDPLAGALNALRALIEQHRDQIPEVARVEKDVDDIDREARGKDPDKERLRDTLKRIAGRVVMVAPVLSAVNDVWEVVEKTVG